MRDIQAIQRKHYSDYQKLLYGLHGKAPSVDKIVEFLKDGVIFIIEEDFIADGLMGFVQAKKNHSDLSPIITGVGVAKHHQKTGYGRKLVGAVIETFPERVFARVPMKHQDVNGFFLACGFHIFQFKKDVTVLRRDLSVDTATLDRLGHIIGTNKTTGYSEDTGCI